MKEKYLPIGSIVKVKKLDRDIIIVGYYSLAYNNSVKIFDYEGLAYPEGTLLKNTSFSFNHSDIEEVLYLGYESDAYKTLNNNLNNQQGTSSKDMTKPDSFVNLKFDENGVVVYNEMSNTKKDAEIIKPANVSNPFSNTNANVTTNASKPIINNNFVFDENGVVVGDKSQPKKMESNYKFTFDENGNVTQEEATEIPKTDDTELQKSNYTYEFDENGIVTAIKEISEKKEEPKDSAVSFTGPATPAAPIMPNTEEFVMPHYQFDENGIIISN